MRIQARGIDAALRKLEEMRGRVANLRPAMEVIGEMILEETRQSFRQEASPDGTKWAPLSDVTILRRVTRTNKTGKRLQRFGPAKEFAIHDIRRARTKSGRATKRAIAAFTGGAKILYDRGHLFGGISSTASDRTLRFGSDVVYARAQQLGNPDNKMFGKKLAPIPARPFFPVVDLGGGRWAKMTTGRGGEMWRQVATTLRQYVLTGKL